MDPLAILRDYFARGELDRVVFSGDDILFGGDYSFPASTPTAFRSKQSGRPYPLSAAVFLAHNHRLKHTDYLQSSRLRRLPPVSLPDRKPLLDYLLGLSSLPHFDSDASDPPPPLQTLNPKPEPPHEPGTPDLVEPSGTLLRRLERPLRSRDALLSSRGRDFLAVLSAASRRAAAAAAAAPGDSGAAAQQSNSSIANPRPKLEKLGGEGFVPIILVPSASQTLITIYNVKEFLEDGVFVTSEEKTKAMRGGAKPEVVTVQKKLIRGERNGPGAGGGAVVACEVRDKPTGLKPEDWGRVVAAFVLGKEWQFKDWPFKDHVEIFNKIIGFYVRFEDDSVESAKVVKQWNVKIISISKNKRHQDRAAALEVWERLEEFIRSHSHN